MPLIIPFTEFSEFIPIQLLISFFISGLFKSSDAELIYLLIGSTIINGGRFQKFFLYIKILHA